MALDTFTRADSASLGANWTDIQGTNGIVSNEASGKTGSVYNISKWNAGAAAAAQWSEVKIGGTFSAGTSQCGCVTRGAGTTAYDGYLLWTNGGANRIYRLDAGAFNLVADLGGAAASGDTFRLDSNGNTHTILKNTVSQGSGSDSTYPTNLVVGIMIFDTSVSTLDDFDASVSAGGGGAVFGPSTLTMLGVQ